MSSRQPETRDPGPPRSYAGAVSEGLTQSPPKTDQGASSARLRSSGNLVSILGESQDARRHVKPVTSRREVEADSEAPDNHREVRRKTEPRKDDENHGRWSLRMLGLERQAPEAPKPPEVTVEQYKDLSTKFHKSEGILRELQDQVSELQGTIAHLNRRDGETSKDDSYIASKFDAIAIAIVAWVLAHFRGTNTTTETNPPWEQLPSDIKESLRPYRKTGLLKSRKTRLLVIGGIVAEIFRTQLFNSLPFGAPGGGEQFAAIQNQLKGTDYQIQRWRALTVNLYTKNSDFEAFLSEQVKQITEALEKLLACFVPEESNGQTRNNELHKLVNEAAILAIEVRGQGDLIELLPIGIGSLYSQYWMNDLVCHYEEHELEAKKATVNLQVFPIVVRRGFKPDGSFWDPLSVVMRGNVLTSTIE